MKGRRVREQDRCRAVGPSRQYQESEFICNAVRSCGEGLVDDLSYTPVPPAAVRGGTVVSTRAEGRMLLKRLQQSFGGRRGSLDQGGGRGGGEQCVGTDVASRRCWLGWEWKGGLRGQDGTKASGLPPNGRPCH